MGRTETRRWGKSQKQHAQWGQRWGAVSPGQGHCLGTHPQETSSAVAGAAGWGMPTQSLGRAPGVSPQPQGRGACSRCSLEGTLTGEEGLP